MNHGKGGTIPDQAKTLLCKAAEQLDAAISDDPDLKQHIINIMEIYLYDNLWPSNFRELERALDRLKSDLSQILRLYLVNDPDVFLTLYDQFPKAVVAFLKQLQERYYYKYSVAAFRTVLANDGFLWRTVHVDKSNKDGVPCFGISIVRNDGEHLYFEGKEDSIILLISIIQNAVKTEPYLNIEEDKNA